MYSTDDDVFSDWETQRENVSEQSMGLLWPEGEVLGLRRCDVFTTTTTPLCSLLTCDLEESRAWRYALLFSMTYAALFHCSGCDGVCRSSALFKHSHTVFVPYRDTFATKTFVIEQTGPPRRHRVRAMILLIPIVC